MVDIAPPPSIPEKRIASNFDWRPYIELDDSIAPEKKQALEQALDILAKYHPSFPDTLKRACSPFIMEQRQNMLNAKKTFGRDVP